MRRLTAEVAGFGTLRAGSGISDTGRAGRCPVDPLPLRRDHISDVFATSSEITDEPSAVELGRSLRL